MLKEIVAVVHGEPPNSYDNPMPKHLLDQVKFGPQGSTLVARGHTIQYLNWEILPLLGEGYEFRSMSIDQVPNHVIEYAFIYVGNFAHKTSLSFLSSAFDSCRNVFLFHDFNSFWLLPTALVFLEEYKEKITGLIVHNPDVVNVVEKVTGIKTLVGVSTTDGLEEDIKQAQEPTKELLVTGGLNERGGIVGNTFAEYHFKGNYDVIQRFPHELPKVLDGCANFYEHMELDAWRKFIVDYKYIIDGSNSGCSYGRVGWDAFCSGRSFISVKNRSYVSYLFDAISINSEVNLADWEDIGWQEAHKLAKERLVTKEDLHAMWLQVL